MRPQATSAIPDTDYLQVLYDNPTFQWLKLEVEGNQYDYDVEDDPDYFLDEVLGRAGLNESEFQYIRAYNDGSVNTEITFTVELSPNGVEMSKKLMRAFDGMLDNIDNAGMHVTLMPPHPYSSREPELDATKLRHFTQEVEPILPFIQLLGQSSRFHRGARYCGNVVGRDKAGYPAVNIQDNRRVEFRFFHPCYDNPDLLDHYLEVVSRMWEYYEDPTKKVALHGGTGTYRQLQDTAVFNRYAAMQTEILPSTLAFTDIFSQFTGRNVQVWRNATGFNPKTLPQFWADKHYRAALKSRREVEQIASKRYKKATAKWLVGDKTALYDQINIKALNGTK